MYESHFLHRLWLLVAVLSHVVWCKDDGEERADEESENNSMMILLVVFLLIITVLTLWLFKLRKFRFIHETGLCMFYGMVAGAIIRYTDSGIYRKVGYSTGQAGPNG